MAPRFSPFSTLTQAEAAFQTFPSLKPLLTILIWSKNNKRPLCLALQVYKLAISGIKRGPGKKLPLWGRRAYYWEVCLLWELDTGPFLPLSSAEWFLTAVTMEHPQRLWAFAVTAQVSLPGALWHFTGLLPPPNIHPTLGSNLVLGLRGKSFGLRQISNLYFPFILLLVITPLRDLHDKDEVGHQ